MSASNPAETYERYMVPVLFAPWAERLLQFAPAKASERVLDLGCGTGVVARRVAAHTGAAEVVGLDLNPNMLAVAREAAARDGVAIDWREGRAEQLPFRDGSFDLALCQFALMFFADRRAALAELHRVLRPGGRAALAVWQGLDRHPFYATLDRAIERRIGASSLRDIFALGDPDELRALLGAAGFHDAEIEPIEMTARFPDPHSFLAGEIDVDTAAIPAMQHLDADARRRISDAIRSDMAAALREATVEDHVVLPFHALLVRAQH